MYLKLQNNTVDLHAYSGFCVQSSGSHIYGFLTLYHDNLENGETIYTGDLADAEALYEAILVAIDQGNRVFDLPRWIKIRGQNFSLADPVKEPIGAEI